MRSEVTMASSEKKLVSFPLSMWSVVIAFMADWLLFAVNLLSDLRALPTALLTGGALAGLATAAVEHFEHGMPAGRSALRGMGVALLVAAPLPMLGTFLAVLAVAWSLTVGFNRSRGKPQVEAGLRR